MEIVTDSNTAADGGTDESWDDLVDAVGGIEAWHEKFAGDDPFDVVDDTRGVHSITPMSEQDYADWEQAGGPVAEWILEERYRREG